MAYRLAMMTLASTAFLSVWTLTRRLAGEKAALLALLLAATTPFLVHEIWFTWPKLLAASLVLLSAVTLIERRPFAAGLLLGVGYLVHPLALFSLPALALLALWPFVGAGLSRRSLSPRLVSGFGVPRPRGGSGLLLLVGVGVCIVLWRLVNGSHYTQSTFLQYLTHAGTRNTMRGHLLEAVPPPATLSAWLSDRVVSVANTLVPLRLFFLSAHDLELNAVSSRCFLCVGNSPAVVHFFFQYWTTVPFGLGILFFPLLLQSLWRAVIRWPWAVAATVVMPFLIFAAYWGGSSTGLLREGLHTWVITLLILTAIEQRHEGFAWLKSASIRALLALRSVEVLLVAMLPTLATRQRLDTPAFTLTDIVAVAAMVTTTGYLGSLVWRAPSFQTAKE